MERRPGRTYFEKVIGHSEDPRAPYWREIDASESATGRPKAYTAERLLAILPAGGLTRADWKKLALNVLEMSESTFKRLKKELTDDEAIHLSPVTDKWQPIFKGSKGSNEGQKVVMAQGSKGSPPKGGHLEPDPEPSLDLAHNSYEPRT